MDSRDEKNEQWPEYGKSVYVPENIYHSYQNYIEMMKKALCEFHKVRDEIILLDN